MTQAQTEHRRYETPSGASEEYVGYEVLDPMGHKIGRVEKLFFNGSGRPEYIRVRMGILFTRDLLIPVQDVALDRVSQSLTLR